MGIIELNLFFIDELSDFQDISPYKVENLAGNRSLGSITPSMIVPFGKWGLGIS